MDRHSKTYELYCSVVGQNIIVEETVFHNGEKSARCLHGTVCESCGGCKNKILNERILKKVEKR